MFWKLLISFYLSSSLVWAAEDNALESYLASLETLQGQFSQNVYDEQGLLLETSSGEFALQRPGKFYWQYSKPYQQLIVANGQSIWIYDQDLLQVTHKAYNAALANTPVLLFTQQKKLAEHFNVRSLPAEIKSIQQFELSAKSPDSGFQTMIVSLEQGQLQQLQLQDNLGQRTEIHFSALKQNQALNAISFDFVVPTGVDVIEDQ